MMPSALQYTGYPIYLLGFLQQLVQMVDQATWAGGHDDHYQHCIYKTICRQYPI